MSEWVPPGATPEEMEHLTKIEAGIPEYMRPHVEEWLCRTLEWHLSDWDIKGVRELSLRMKTDFGGDQDQFRQRVSRLSERDLVWAVDAALAYSIGRARMTTHSLAKTLEDGRAGWMLSKDAEGSPRLTERIPSGVREAFDYAAQATTRAGRHLADAFEASYGVAPNPSHSYSESVKAVEALAIPAFLPRDTNATLGKVVNHLNSKVVSIPHVRQKNANHQTTVVGMMQTLWEASERHEGQDTYSDITPEGAKAAHSLAVCLVQLVHEGLIEKG